MSDYVSDQSSGYYGHHARTIDTAGYVPNFTLSGNNNNHSSNNSHHSPPTTMLSDIIDTTSQIRLQPIAESPVVVTSSYQPVATQSYPCFDTKLYTSPESPLCATGSALTCDVQAVIQHEFSQPGSAANFFNFNMDFPPPVTTS